MRSGGFRGAIRRSALGLSTLGGLAVLSTACVAPGPAAAPSGVAAPTFTTTTFPGRDAKLRWGRGGAIHAVFVAATDPPQVLYRRLGQEPSEAVPVSPPALPVNAHGEVPPTLEELPDGTLVVAYTVARPGRFQGEIRLQRSTDGGATWSAPVLLHDDGDRGGSHSFLASTLNHRGEAVFAWLDNRDGTQGLWSARSPDGLAVSPNRSLDAITCQCCATELLTGSDGRLFLAYRDMEDDNTRDIYLTRSTDHGATFTPAVPVSPDGWRLDACPHSGPRLAEDRRGRVWAVWFTGAEPGIYAAVSEDGGASFGPREPLVQVTGDRPRVAHPELGRLPDGRLVVVWEESRVGAGEGTREVLVAKAEAEGGWGPAMELAPGGAYPRVVAGPGRTVLAFTEPGNDGPRVVVADLETLLEGGALP
jgi:hypothetical protein